MGRPRVLPFRGGICRHCQEPFVWRQLWRLQRPRTFCSKGCWSAFHVLRRQKMPLGELVRRYLAGESTLQIARAGGYVRRDGGSLGRRLKAAGVQMRPRGRHKKGAMR